MHLFYGGITNPDAIAFTAGLPRGDQYELGHAAQAVRSLEECVPLHYPVRCLNCRRMIDSIPCHHCRTLEKKTGEPRPSRLVVTGPKWAAECNRLEAIRKPKRKKG